MINLPLKVRKIRRSERDHDFFFDERFIRMLGCILNSASPSSVIGKPKPGPMKRNRILISTLLFAGVLLAFTGCKKDKEETTDTSAAVIV